MRYPASEKIEIIRIVEQSGLSAGKTLEQIGVPRATFYRWYEQYQTGGPEALEDRPSQPSRVWNRIPDDVRGQIIALALEQPKLSPRELAVRFAAFIDHYNHRRYHESLDNLTPADVYFGRGLAILLERARIKRQTITQGRLLHQKIAA